MDCYQKYIPNIVNKTRIEIDTLIERLRSNTLSKEDADFFVGCTELSIWLPHALQEKEISINNLRRLLFGKDDSKKGGKNKGNKGDKDGKNNNESDQLAEKNSDVDASSENIPDSNTTEPSSNDAASADQLAQKSNVIDMKDAIKKSGHGRMGFDVYKNAQHITVAHNTYKAGDYCPEKCGGKLYPLKPGHVTRIVGNPPMTVTVYVVSKFRCSSCTTVFSADLPYGVSEEKYDYAVKAQIAIQKYFMGSPFYRQQDYYAMLESPIADATQFELCEQVADAGYRVVGALEKIAANAELVHFDDTHAKILSVIAQNKANEDQERMGMHTTGIIAKTSDEKTIALFYTGTSHAGDNLIALLQHRIDDKEKIVAMCDALAANMPKSLQAIICNCMGHGFRKFRDLLDYFPEICLHVMQELGKVYKFDELTKGMSKLERLAFHREHSKPIMLKLHAYLKKQLADKLVEPNSSLGKAIKYMLKHWKKLRRFLTTPGAPIDNNIVERALKIPIRNRKNAMFYKTLHGATIGNILISLIYTVKLAKVNPIEYLIALQENKSAVHKNPEEWVPWQYKETLKNRQLNAAAA